MYQRLTEPRGLPKYQEVVQDRSYLHKVREAAMSKMFEDLQQGLAEVDALLGGEKAGYKVTLPAEIDVKSIRKGLNMT